MRTVLLEVPEAMLAGRRRLELDERDEVWNGVLHMVPPAGGPHQRLGSELLQVLAPLGQRRGLVASYETGLFRTADDYRVPDQLYCRPEHESERGAEGAELVVEIRSKSDETYEKIDGDPRPQRPSGYSLTTFMVDRTSDGNYPGKLRLAGCWRTCWK